MADLKISIPQPCPQKWNKMTPAQGGRFCNQCDKVIVDFTKMNDDELLHYFNKNCNTEICGLFNNTQIEQKNSKQLAFFVKIKHQFEAIKFKPLQRVSLFLLAFSMTVMGCKSFYSTTLGIMIYPNRGKKTDTYNNPKFFPLKKNIPLDTSSRSK